MKTTETHGTLNQETLDNLSTAMHGEAFAYGKYLLYAEHARKSGSTELAELFEKTAKVERFGTTRSRVNFFMYKFRKLGFIQYDGEIHINDSLLSVVLHD